jgi:ABC-type bacteriocin/lantibiotic exporter with double-glycine peptidase domain
VNFPRAAALLLVLAVFAGCASRPPVRTGQPRPLVFHVSGVPFFEDDADQCGPSSLASLLSFWGYAARPAALRKEFLSLNADGADIEVLARAASARGLQAEVQAGSPEVLMGELRAGHPVLLVLNLGYELLPRRHYAVVTGYDDLRGGYYLHSGRPDRFVSSRWLMSRWENAAFQWIRVLPVRPGASPAQP